MNVDQPDRLARRAFARPDARGAPVALAAGRCRVLPGAGRGHGRCASGGPSGNLHLRVRGLGAHGGRSAGARRPARRGGAPGHRWRGLAQRAGGMARAPHQRRRDGLHLRPIGPPGPAAAQPLASPAPQALRGRRHGRFLRWHQHHRRPGRRGAGPTGRAPARFLPARGRPSGAGHGGHHGNSSGGGCAQRTRRGGANSRRPGKRCANRGRPAISRACCARSRPMPARR